MIKDYSKQVSKMSDGELSRRIEEIGKGIFRGPDNVYLLFCAMFSEQRRRDAAEKEFLSREQISRFEMMEL